MSTLDRFFRLKERGSTVGTELRGAVATFLTMAYILFANPGILAAAGIPIVPATASTATAAGICCILMGLCSNLPVALASGMGLNAIVAFTIAQKTGSWQTAMGIVVLDGVVVLLLVLSGLREAVMDAIPLDLRRAIGAGIGLFIAFIGLVNAKIVLLGLPEAPVKPGSFHSPEAIVAAVGVVLTAFLLARRVTGAFLLGIAGSTTLALILKVAKPPTAILQAPSFELLGQANIGAAMALKYLPLLFALIMVDFFDTLGTATAIAEQARLEEPGGRIPGLRGLLIVDSISAAIGGFFGASSVTCYIESASGVAEGARTGLHTVFVGLLFLLAIFAAPLAAMVPGAATAPALVLVGFLMLSHLPDVDWKNLYTAIPAFITLVTIPLTYSIAHGVGYGFITYTLIAVLSGRGRDVKPVMYVTAAAFLAYFIWGGS